jgi:hypothetical protein
MNKKESLLLEHIKKLPHINKKMANRSVKEWTKDLSKHFANREIQMAY